VGHFRKRLKIRITIKNLIYLSLLLVQIACKGNGQEANEPPEKAAPSEQPAKQDTLKQPQQSEKQQSGKAQALNASKVKDKEKWRRPQSLDIHGVWRQGNFRWYQPVTKNADDLKSYGGRPKVEVLGKDEEVIKTIDIVDFQNLYDQFDSISFIGAHSPYKVHFKEPGQAESYAIYSDIFPDRDLEVELLCRHEYHYNEGVLWIVTVGYAMEFDVIGAKTEIVGIDSVGNEIARKTIDGNSISVSFSENNQFLASTTGGRISERVEYTNPMHFYLFDLKKDELLYHYKASEEEPIMGSIFRGNAQLTLYAELKNGLRGIKNVLIIMYNKGVICYLDKNLYKLYGKGALSMYKKYIEYITVDGKIKDRYQFEKDFNCKELQKKE